MRAATRLQRHILVDGADIDVLPGQTGHSADVLRCLRLVLDREHDQCSLFETEIIGQL